MGSTIEEEHDLFTMSLLPEEDAMEHKEAHATDDVIVQMKQALNDKNMLNELLLRKFNEFKTNHEQMRQDFENKISGIEMKKFLNLQLLKNPSITDENLEPEKMKKLKKQRNRMVENQEKMREYFGRLKTREDEMIGNFKVNDKEDRIALKQVEKQGESKYMYLTERVKSLERKLVQIRKEEEKNHKTLEEKAFCYHRQDQLRKGEQIRSSAETGKIHDLERCVRNLENSLAEKELEIWNLRQLLRDAGLHVARAIATVLTNSAVKIEGLQKVNDELRGRQKLTENGIYECDEELLVDGSKIEHTALNRAHCKKGGTKKRLCEAQMVMESAKFNSRDMEKKWKEAEEEKKILIKYLKEITIAKSDLLQASYSLNEEVKLQDERLLAIEEKFESIEKIGSREKYRNETVADGMKLIENRVKRIHDSMSNGKKKRKNIIQRFFARNRNRNENV